MALDTSSISNPTSDLSPTSNSYLDNDITPSSSPSSLAEGSTTSPSSVSSSSPPLQAVDAVTKHLHSAPTTTTFSSSGAVVDLTASTITSSSSFSSSTTTQSDPAAGPSFSQIHSRPTYQISSTPTATTPKQSFNNLPPPPLFGSGSASGPKQHVLSNPNPPQFPNYRSYNTTPNRYSSHSLSRPQGGGGDAYSPTSLRFPKDKQPTGMMALAKAYGFRAGRILRRGNLIFLLLFLSCTIIFFSALSGVGYVDPNPYQVSSSSQILEDDSGLTSFEPAVPLHAGSYVRQPDLNGGLSPAQLRRMEEERALEESWVKKKRPKDGAWMQAFRDDRAVRRVQVKPTAVDNHSHGEKKVEIDEIFNQDGKLVGDDGPARAL